MANNTSNKNSFYISLLDLFVELGYKIITNARILGSRGVFVSNATVELVFTLLAMFVTKVNNYWNQYFQPFKKENNNEFKDYIEPNLYYLFVLFVFYVITCKLLVDYRHFKATVFDYMIPKISIGYSIGFGWFFYIYIISALADSLLTSITDWYVNIYGKKIDSFTLKNINFYIFDFNITPIKFKLGDFVSSLTTSLNHLNNFFEAIYYTLLIYFHYTFFWASIICPFYVCSAIVSSYIKTQVRNYQNTNANGGTTKMTPSYSKQIIVLLLFFVMVISPLIQFQVILVNVAGYFGLATSSIFCKCFTLFFCSTFMLHKFVQKGDQVYKYLYGTDYSSDGYTMLGFNISGDTGPASSESLTNLANNVITSMPKEDRSNDLDPEETLMRRSVK